MKKSTLLIVATLLLCLGAQARALDLQARLDRAQVSLGEPVQLTVEVSGDRLAPPELPDLSGSFQVRASGTQQSISVIQGEVSARSTHTYELTPLKEGALTIPPIRLGAYHSDPLQLEVGPAPAPAPAQPSAPQSSSSPVFLEAEISDPNPYVRQEILYTARLYRDPRLPRLDLELPSFTGFVAGQPERTESTIDQGTGGYQVTQISVPLFPTAEGRHHLEGTSGVYRGRLLRDLASRPMDVEVRPLPARGRPADFHGAVGDFFSLSAEVQGDKVVATVTGQSLPGWVPTVDFPADSVEVLDQRVEEEPGANRIVYRIRPPEQDTRVPPLQMAYFDPTAGEYRRASTEPLLVPGTIPPEQSAPDHPALEVAEHLQGETPRALPRLALSAAIAAPWLLALFGLIAGRLRLKAGNPNLGRVGTPDEMVDLLRQRPQTEPVVSALRQLDAYRFGGKPWTRGDLEQIAGALEKGDTP